MICAQLWSGPLTHGYKLIYSFHTVPYHLAIACRAVWHDQLVSCLHCTANLIHITVIGFINNHVSLHHVFVYYKYQTSNAILQLKTFKWDALYEPSVWKSYIPTVEGWWSRCFSLWTAHASELVVVFPARTAFIKVNLDLRAHAQFVDSAETESKVVPKKKQSPRRSG